MTDPQTMQEIKDALAAGPGGVSVARDPGIFTANPTQEPVKFDGAGVAVEGAPAPKQITSLPPLAPPPHYTMAEMEKTMEEERTGTKPMMPTTPADKPKGLHQLFTRDELIPLKGVWFKAVEVEEEKLVLVPTHFTRNFAKRNR